MSRSSRRVTRRIRASRRTRVDARRASSATEHCSERGGARLSIWTGPPLRFGQGPDLRLCRVRDDYAVARAGGRARGQLSAERVRRRNRSPTVQARSGSIAEGERAAVASLGRGADRDANDCGFLTQSGQDNGGNGFNHLHGHTHRCGKARLPVFVRQELYTASSQ